jgi:hypothetical protein
VGPAADDAYVAPVEELIQHDQAAAGGGRRPPRASRRLAPAVDHQAAAERTQAARSLLMHLLMTTRGPFSEELPLVRRHQSELNDRPRKRLASRKPIELIGDLLLP